MMGRGVAAFGVVKWRHLESRRDREGLKRHWQVRRRVLEMSGLSGFIMGD